jgi:hypothetical protein
MNFSRRSRIFIVLFMSATVFASFALLLDANPPSTTRPSTEPARGITLFGTVYDSEGTSPISAVLLGVYELGSGKTRNLGKPMCATRANDVGAFAFDQYIPQGSYEILVFGNKGAIIASQTLVVAKETAALTTVQIRTFGGSLEGTVLQVSGLPANGIDVVLNDFGHQKVYSAETNKKGHYVMNYVVPGNYNVFASLDDKNGTQVVDADVKIDGKHVSKDLALSYVPSPNK